MDNNFGRGVAFDYGQGYTGGVILCDTVYYQAFVACGASIVVRIRISVPLKWDELNN